MLRLFRSRTEPGDVDEESRRHDAAHSALMQSLRHLLEERNRADGMVREQQS